MAEVIVNASDLHVMDLVQSLIDNCDRHIADMDPAETLRASRMQMRKDALLEKQQRQFRQIMADHGSPVADDAVVTRVNNGDSVSLRS